MLSIGESKLCSFWRSAHPLVDATNPRCPLREALILDSRGETRRLEMALPSMGIVSTAIASQAIDARPVLPARDAATRPANCETAATVHHRHRVREHRDVSTG